MLAALLCLLLTPAPKLAGPDLTGAWDMRWGCVDQPATVFNPDGSYDSPRCGSGTWRVVEADADSVTVEFTENGGRYGLTLNWDGTAAGVGYWERDDGTRAYFGPVVVTLTRRGKR